MAITVVCPGCSAELNAPESAAGKKVKCPRPGCGTVMIIPELLSAEVAEEEPRAASRQAAVEDDDDERPRKKRRYDDDDDDYDDRPRKRKRKKPAGVSPGLIAAIAIGCVLLVGGAGFGVYMLVKKDDTAKKDSGGGTTGGANAGGENNGGNNGGSNTGGGLNLGGSGLKARVPPGWVQYTPPTNQFKAYFPKPPIVQNLSPIPGQSISMALSGGPRERLAAIVMAMKLPPQAAGINKDQIAEQIRQGMMQRQGKVRVVSQRSVTWAGRSALEMTLEQTGKSGKLIMRQLITETNMYLAFIGAADGRLTPDEENGFFDNFEIVE